MQESCPFCELNADKNKILHEGKNVFVTLSNPRLVPGHVLVIPKRHVEKISDLREDEKKELFDTAVQFQEKVLLKFSSGCDIRQNYRPFQKQDKIKVDHLHIHLLPRGFKDELYQKCQIYETSIFTPLTNEERIKFETLLKE